MQRIFNNTFLILFLLAIFFVACKKGSIETNYNPVLNVANNQVIAERAYSQVFNIFFMVVSDSSLKNTGSDTIFGAHCTYQDTDDIVYVIDYFDYYTSCPDGKVRKGMITATLDKDFSKEGATATLTFDNYVVDDLMLNGENTISFFGYVQGIKAFTHDVPSGILTLYDTVSHGSFSWSSSKNFSWVEGMSTPEYFDDDVFEISGTSNGVDLYNAAFSSVIDEPLGDYFDCRWIRGGQVSLSTPGLDVRNGYILYNPDSCTNLVEYYFNGNLFYDKFEKH
ncbi:MAG: hypothetical protein V2I47_10005 [Bacteroidales bacterium]|jgi:hypothetical protein|nr:hypothetical protein [Bacteroidales bacterium]